LRGSGRGLGTRGSEASEAEESSLRLPPERSWWGLGGRAGGSGWHPAKEEGEEEEPAAEEEEEEEPTAADGGGGTERLWGSGTGRRHGLLRSYTLYGGGVLFSRRTGSSEAELGRPAGVARGPWAWPWQWPWLAAAAQIATVPYSVADASDTLQRLREEMPLL